MTGGQLKARLARAERVYGTMLTAPGSIRDAWMLRRLGLDFAVVDTEHASLGRADVEHMLAAIAVVGCVPFVRVAARDPVAVTQALDAGAHGVIIPYCETVGDVTACVAAARYHPVKGARIADAARARPLPAKTLAVVERANRHVITVVGIESQPAVDCLESLLAIERVDAVFVGTHDLSYSLGEPNDLDHPTVKRAFAHVLTTCARLAIPVCIWPLPLKLTEYWVARGMNLVLHSSDHHAMFEGFQRDFERLRRDRKPPRKR